MILKNILKKVNFSYSWTPLVLLVLVFLAYGLLIRNMGFFMDDWYLIWYKQLFGAIKYPEYFSLDRPLMGYFYVVANFILGNSESPIVWQIFGLITRWLSAYSMWIFLNTLWPDSKKDNTLFSLLAVVFPGFTQQWIAIIYSFFFSCLALFFFSLTLMIKGLRNPKKFWVFTIISLLVGFYSYAASEFYFGLELIRPIVIWIEISRQQKLIKTSILKSLKTWIPYLLVYVLFAIWRGFVFVSVNHDVTITSQLQNSRHQVFLDSLNNIYQGIMNSALLSWVNTFNINNYPARGKAPLFVIGLIIVVFFGLVIWLRKVQNSNTNYPILQNRRWKFEVLLLSLVSLLVAALPIIAAGLTISLDYPNDRFLLPFIFGGCLLLVLFLRVFRKGTLFIVAVLVAMSVGFQFVNGLQYRNMWAQQSNMFWQLTWRAPEIKPGTALVTDNLPFSKLFSTTSLTAPLNMIYDNDLVSHDIPYFFLMSSFEPNLIQNYAPDHSFDFSFRNFEFSGNTSALLLFTYPSDGCLRVVSANDDVNIFRESGYYYFWNRAIASSNVDQIVTNSASPKIPPKIFFGHENRDQWCYYYEKADLARQVKNWDQIISLYEEAQGRGFKPLNDLEWIPLMDAYINNLQYSQALEVTYKAKNNNNAYTEEICNLWTKYSTDISQVKTAIEYLKCK